MEQISSKDIVLSLGLGFGVFQVIWGYIEIYSGGEGEGGREGETATGRERERERTCACVCIYIYIYVRTYTCRSVDLYTDFLI